MVAQGDLDMSVYLNEFPGTNEPEQKNNTFWFATPGTSEKSEDHTPIETRILKGLFEPEKKEKLNPQENTESILQSNFSGGLYGRTKLL